jgi:exosortase
MAERTFREELERFRPEPPVIAAWLLLAALFVWFYWSSFERLVGVWYNQEAYVYGFIVPIFAVVLLWLRRDMLAACSGKGSWWGLAVLLLWALIRWGTVYFNYEAPREYSMLVFLLGMAIFVGGWSGLRWSWPAIVFLVFMIPLPGFVQGAFSLWLQRIAAKASEFVIQTVGVPAMAIGHKIQVGDAKQELDVAAACSGLKMLMLFFAMCVGMAFVAKRPLWEKIVLIVSAAPIAVISNVIRIVTVALICEGWRNLPQSAVDKWVGIFVMMPAGLLLLWGEMTLLSKLLIEAMPERPLVVGRVRS